MNPLEKQKQRAALAALDFIEDKMILGIGTGSTTNYFIDALVKIKDKIEGAIPSSIASAERLRKIGIPCFELNSVGRIPLYIDGADQINSNLQLIKGGGGALTREKIIAHASDRFICIADQTKRQGVFGDFPLPIEVIPMARSMVARELVKLGGSPVYRDGFITDNGNIILDIYHLVISEPIKLEQAINNIPGVVCHGLFAMRPADIVLLADAQEVQTVSV
jgi:ribose 5-phosphate isomerase A